MLKTYHTLHSCHNFPAGSRQAARGARFCETSLLHSPLMNATLSYTISYTAQEWEYCIWNAPKGFLSNG